MQQCRVGVVHGDADALAGWRFDPSSLDQAGNHAWLHRAFEHAAVDLFASTHTCMPALRRVGRGSEFGIVINNGAAGMPNFRADTHGMITRIGTRPAPHPSRYGARLRGAFVDALAVDFDPVAFRKTFLRNWPEGSDAHQSYFQRITEGTSADVADACR